MASSIPANTASATSAVMTMATSTSAAIAGSADDTTSQPLTSPATAMIAVGAILGVLGVLGVISLIWWMRRRALARDAMFYPMQDGEFGDGGGGGGLGYPPRPPPKAAFVTSGAPPPSATTKTTTTTTTTTTTNTHEKMEGKGRGGVPLRTQKSLPKLKPSARARSATAGSSDRDKALPIKPLDSVWGAPAGVVKETSLALPSSMQKTTRTTTTQTPAPLSLGAARGMSEEERAERRERSGSLGSYKAPMDLF